MLKQYKNIFLVGAGGIGLSGLGRILKESGKNVSGSDINQNEITADLKKIGVEVFFSHDEGNITNQIELVIYSQAISESNPELVKARKQNIKTMSYPEALGEILGDYFVIAISGTNGKTTTTGMLASIMEEAGMDPTVLVGSKMKQWDSNARLGKSKFFLIEADEYKRAFLNYNPDIAVILNISADHLDYYKDVEDVQNAFAEFANNTKSGGVVIFNQDDDRVTSVANKLDPASKVKGFEIDQAKFDLKLPGDYNQANASAAASVADALSIDPATVAEGLRKFEGTWRRFELVGSLNETKVISDYAHHPDGVRAILKTAITMYKNPLFVYQPHQHNRTKSLFKEFVKEFSEAKEVDLIITEIFDVKGREEDKDQDVSSVNLVEEISKERSNVSYAENSEMAEKMIRDVAGEHDAIFIVGAGDIYLVAERLVK